MPDSQRDPQEMQDKLDDVGREIDDAEDRAGEILGHQEQSFVDPGEIGREQTDDAIVPPG